MEDGIILTLLRQIDEINLDPLLSIVDFCENVLKISKRRANVNKQWKLVAFSEGQLFVEEESEKLRSFLPSELHRIYD